jgi:hypothetical protein
VKANGQYPRDWSCDPRVREYKSNTFRRTHGWLCAESADTTSSHDNRISADRERMLVHYYSRRTFLVLHYVFTLSVLLLKVVIWLAIVYDSTLSGLLLGTVISLNLLSTRGSPMTGSLIFLPRPQDSIRPPGLELKVKNWREQHLAFQTSGLHQNNAFYSLAPVLMSSCPHP